MRVALVNCVELPEPDPDAELTLGALRAAGMHADLLAWDDPGADPAGFDLCVLRATWNYYRNVDAFLEWLARAERATSILNPPGVVRWNHHKRYLEELERAGIPIIPTRWIARGESISVAGTGWDRVVVKPAVSAGSWRTARFDDRAAAQSCLDALAAEQDAMVQPFMSEFDRSGERALVWIDAAWTHAIRKSSRFAGEDEQVSEALAVTAEERDFGERVLGAPVLERVRPELRNLLYARVDVVRDDAGRLRLSELEVIEPSLFLRQCPAALDRLVAAVRRRI